MEMGNITFDDPCSWAATNAIKLQGGTWSYDDHEYLREPMQIPLLQRYGKAPLRVCAMKATQLGWTEAMVLIMLHSLIYGHYKKGALYLFPTKDEVSDFSRSRFNPLIQLNPSAIGQYVKDTDNANLKNINGAMLYLRGTKSRLKLEAGTKESPQLRGLPVDAIVFDELDMMEFEDAIAKAEGRLGASNVGASYFISNPTLPERGIASLYEKSDQRKWFRKCDCGAWTCAVEHFPDLVGKDKDGKGYIACKKCGKPTDPRKGQWVAEKPSNSGYMWGYQLSQLESCTRRNDPLEILNDYNDPPAGNVGDIIRLRLGKPYISAEDKLTTQQVLACCGFGLQKDSHTGPCAMGVDVKPSHKNVVIGIRSGTDRYKILRVARVQGGLEAWDEIMRMAMRFNVKSAIVDVRPLTDAARDFQKKAKFRTYLCEYSESTPVGTVYNDRTGLVKVNRTELCDATHRLIADENRLELPAKCPEINQFAIECCNIAKCEMIDTRTKAVIYRYIKTGNNPDDYRHALNYFYLACSGGKVPVVGASSNRRRLMHAVTEYSPW